MDLAETDLTGMNFTRVDLAALRQAPNALAAHYSRFRVAERLLLTGHSHQAWPDLALAGQLEAFIDAAVHVDDKWGRAFAKAGHLAKGLATWLEDASGGYALGGSTHDLVIRFLSALPLARRPRLVTTDGEFHTLRRQLARLAEEGIEVVRVPSAPATGVAERLCQAIDDRTAAVLTSSVFFHSGTIATGLGEVLGACQHHGAELLVDSYHSLGVVPLSLPAEGLGGAFVVGGGYKYLQMGEGNCFLRVPPGRNLRPVVTGWFAEFADLTATHGDGVFYGTGAAAFAGSTYDPTSHYRACAVLDFWEEKGLTPAFLRQVSQHQVGLLAELFDHLDLPPALVTRDRATPLSGLGGFLALRSPRAEELSQALREREVATDSRGDVLRFGPAPYLADAQLEAAMAILGEVARSLPAHSGASPREDLH